MNTSGFSKEQATLISFGAMAVALLFQPLLGAISDRVGRRPVLLFFGIGATLGTVPVLRLLAHASSTWAAFGLLVAVLFVVSAYTSISAVVKAELFPTQVRALGVGLPYALTVAIFGGTAEYLALFAKGAGPRRMVLLVRDGLRPTLATRVLAHGRKPGQRAHGRGGGVVNRLSLRAQRSNRIKTSRPGTVQVRLLRCARNDRRLNYR